MTVVGARRRLSGPCGLRTACRIDDWTDGLITYLSDPVARSRAVDRGRALAERRYDVSTIAARWRVVLDDRM